MRFLQVLLEAVERKLLEGLTLHPVIVTVPRHLKAEAGDVLSPLTREQ